MKQKLTEARVFALKGFTIKSDGDRFFISPTGRDAWSGPHKSLQHATTAIARKLSHEFVERNARLERWKARTS